MVCLKHHDRDAASCCAACGKPVCDECLREAGNTGYCSPECQNRGEAARKRSVEVISIAKKSDRKSGFRKFIWVVILLLIAAAALFLYSKKRSEVDSAVAESKNRIMEIKDEVIRSGKEAMPQDSKYKQEREKLVK